MIILENDLYRRFPRSAVDEFFGSAERTIALDHLANETTARASLLLPAATIAESDGTLVSSEGRAQRFFQIFPPQPEIRESWRWLRDPAWNSLDDVLAAMAESAPQLAPLLNAAPPENFRIAGAKVPREPHRYSGRTAKTANITVVEPKPPADPDSALSYSMEGASVQPPSALQPFFWTPGWNSIQAVNKFQSEIGNAMRGGDPGVRLFASSSDGSYHNGIPAAFAPRESEWLVLPAQHIFGTEELSAHAPGIAELAPDPYLAVNAAGAAKLQLDASPEVEITLGGAAYRLPLKIAPELPDGVAAIPDGLTPARGAELPAWTTIRRAQ
jgi:NADH-quinone oxidoreductase subunit G